MELKHLLILGHTALQFRMSVSAIRVPSTYQLPLERTQVCRLGKHFPGNLDAVQPLLSSLALYEEELLLIGAWG